MYVSIADVAGVSPPLNVQLSHWVIYNSSIGWTGWPEWPRTILDTHTHSEIQAMDHIFTACAVFYIAKAANQGGPHSFLPNYV